ncbi:MAG: hypothetical protein RI885_612 [Actinomycetota bacterium]|jgi:hypothetical protein
MTRHAVSAVCHAPGHLVTPWTRTQSPTATPTPTLTFTPTSDDTTITRTEAARP